MGMQNARNAVKVVLGNLGATKPTVKLRTFTMSESGAARVVAEITHTSESKNNDQLVYEALKGHFKNKLVAVESSFAVLASNAFSDVVTGIVIPLTEAIALDKNNQNFVCVAGNMYMNKEDEQLWSLKKTEAGEILIKTSSLSDIADIEELMASCSSNMVNPLQFETNENVMNVFEMVASSVEGGDFVDFYNPETQNVDFGVVVASVEDEATGDTGKLIVLASNSERQQTIERNMIVDAHGDVEVPELEGEVSISGDVNLEHMVEYYRSMFRRSPEYFAKFEARLRAHSFN